MTLKRRLELAIDVLWNLNLLHGHQLNDGLEDKIDQLHNLLEIELQELKD